MASDLQQTNLAMKSSFLEGPSNNQQVCFSLLVALKVLEADQWPADRFVNYGEVE